jgi:DeoR family fructose operon transcriptional repressor
MLPAERRRNIERIVTKQGKVTISELSQMFNVSEMTVHRDLKTLEGMGALRKTRGGALASEIGRVPTDYRKRLQSYTTEKDAIGRKAAEFIKEGDTILLGPGTTSLSVARYCGRFRNLIVYTNGPAVINELAKYPDIEVHCTGGLLDKATMAYVGPETEAAIARLRPDKCFFGAHGFTLEDGVSDPIPLAASSKRKMVEVSQEVYLVVTQDKFGNVAQQISVPLEAIDVVITNKATPKHYLDQLAERGIPCFLDEQPD